MNHHRTVGVLGATSLVGEPLLPLLTAAGWRTIACTRATCLPCGPADGGVSWCHPGDARPGGETVVATWIALCPLFRLRTRSWPLRRLRRRLLVVLWLWRWLLLVSLNLLFLAL